jgi:virginiamycin B lyase
MVHAGPALHEYTIPSRGGGAVRLGGGYTQLWFTETDANRIARLDTDGTITEYPVASPASRPLAISRESHGDFWVAFTQPGTNQVGVVFAGILTEYDIPTPASDPRGIAQSGPIYFTEFEGDRIGELRPWANFPMREIALPPGSGPLGITPGPDAGAGNELWFTEYRANKIGRFAPDLGRGRIIEYSIPTPDSGPTSIVADDYSPDGDVWFLESKADRIGRVDTHGDFDEYDLPIAGGGPEELLAAPDGIWISLRKAGKLARRSWSGEFRVFDLQEGSAPAGLGYSVYEPDLRYALTSIWYVDAARGSIGRLSDNAVFAPGAGYGLKFDTEFQIAGVDGRPPRTRVGLEPPSVCPGWCPDPATVVDTSTGETVRIYASGVPFSDWGGVFRVTEDSNAGVGDLPSASAWILDAQAGRVSLPLVDYWTAADALRGAGRLDRPPILRFPAARDAEARTRLELDVLDRETTSPLSFVIEAVDADGEVVAAKRTEPGWGDLFVFDDVLSDLGVDAFAGEIHVTFEPAGTVLWGVVRISDGNGRLEISGPSVSFADPRPVRPKPRGVER